MKTFVLGFYFSLYYISAMSSEFSRKHPEMAAKLTSLVESGMSAEEIIANFREESENRDNSREVSEERERFPDEIRLISQPLAYRIPTIDDIDELQKLFDSGYSAEIEGPESFRFGPAIDRSLFINLFSDTSYQWLVMEAIDSHKGSLNTASILGACCYSTDGVSRCNGAVDAKL